MVAGMLQLVREIAEANEDGRRLKVMEIAKLPERAALWDGQLDSLRKRLEGGIRT